MARVTPRCRQTDRDIGNEFTHGSGSDSMEFYERERDPPHVCVQMNAVGNDPPCARGSRPSLAERFHRSWRRSGQRLA
jgi:hypothetical protein